MSRSKKHPYTKSKAFDATCRNHGSCRCCATNRCKALRTSRKSLNRKEDES